MIQPEKVARKRYDELKQTGNAFDYVSETQALIQEMEPAENVRPSKGDVLSRFVANAKPDLKDHLLKIEPLSGWRSVKTMFDAAVRYGTIEKHKSNDQVPSAPKKLAAMNPSQRKGQAGQGNRNRNAKRKARGNKGTSDTGTGLAGAFQAGAGTLVARQGAQAPRSGGAGPSHKSKAAYQANQAPLPPAQPVPLTEDQVMARLNVAQKKHVYGGRCPFHPQAGHTLANCDQRPPGF